MGLGQLGRSVKRTSDDKKIDDVFQEQLKKFRLEQKKRYVITKKPVFEADHEDDIGPPEIMVINKLG